MLVVFGLIVVALVAYMTFVRPILAQKYPDLFTKLDEIEKLLIQRSRTLLASRLYWIGGLVLAFHDGLAGVGVDWTPIVDQVSQMIPTQYRSLAAAMVMVGTGLLFEWLRHKTTQSLTNKE